MTHPLQTTALAAFEQSVAAADGPARFARGLVRLTDRPPVSVVIPIYNAVGSLSACLDSLRDTNTEAEVILVDDCSPDLLVRDTCERFCREWPAARIVTATQNRGFVASVNAGIDATDPASDVVLLNSDTEVTPGWLHKLGTAALLDADVASASPLSNAAGVFSLPEAHLSNELPAGWSAQQCNRLLEEVSARAYETVPTTSGFCLYLRRDALDAVGCFDQLLLHRGYGEENDFCERATRAGFGHRLDDTTFVFHEREASFGGSKSALKRRNACLLKAMHPEHNGHQRVWEQATGLGELRDRYSAALQRVLGAPEGPAALASVHTTLTVGGRAEAGWDGAARTAVVQLGPTPSVQLYGLGEVALPVADPTGTVAWLADRLGADELVVEDGALDNGDAERIEHALPRLGRRPRTTTTGVGIQ